VFRVGLTAKTTLRTLNRMICQFYGHPGTDRAFAIALLTATRAEDILTRLRSLTVSPARAYQATPRARATRLGHYYQWRTVSAAAQARFLTALDPHLQPVDRLRYRSCGPTPRLPRSDHQVLDRVRPYRSCSGRNGRSGSPEPSLRAP
jgi:hypothetical protein